MLNANGLVVLAEGVDKFRLGATATGENMNLSGNLFSVIRTLFGWMYGS
jgi:hypothetical protein